MSKKYRSKNKSDKLKVISPKQSSGDIINLNKFVFCKRKHFRIINISLDGAAPKEVIKLYRYQKGKPIIDNRKQWHIYIVKTGHKNYPIESITEQMFSDMGVCLSLNMAETFLGVYSNQLKISSKYFLKKGEKLVKGVEIYSEILDDKKFVDEIEEKGLSRELITIKFTYDSLEKKYKNHQIIFNNYVKLLLFDALVGNNDRHFYNWGVIETKDKNNKKEYNFSPIYDTARGMFWNITELNLQKYREKERLEKYIKDCQAKTSYSGKKKENHFELIKNIFKNKETFNIEISLFNNIINDENLDKINKMLDKRYKPLLSDLRFKLIKICLQKRFEKIVTIINESQ